MSVPLAQQRIFSSLSSPSTGLLGWEWFTVQTSPGMLSGLGRALYLPMVQIHEERFEGVTTHHYGAPPPDSILLSVSLNHQQAALVNGRIWKEGLCVWTSTTEVNAIVPPMTLYTVVLKQQPFIEHVWESEGLDLTAWLKDCPKIRNDSSFSKSVVRRLSSTIAGCFAVTSTTAPQREAEEIQSQILDDIAPAVIEILGLPARRPQRFMAQALVVSKARQFILDNLQRPAPVQVKELCTVLGVSRRQLQVSFNDVLGMGPLAFNRAVRIASAREALMRADAKSSVRQIASKWGFQHQGRFGQAYRAMFGETPSATLRGTAALPSRLDRSQPSGLSEIG